MSVCIQKVKYPFQVELISYYFIWKPKSPVCGLFGFQGFLLPCFVSPPRSGEGKDRERKVAYCSCGPANLESQSLVEKEAKAYGCNQVEVILHVLEVLILF